MSGIRFSIYQGGLEMEFQFKYTVWERVYFVSRAVILNLLRTKKVLLLIGAAWLMMGVSSDFLLFVSGNSDAGLYGAWFLLPGLILFLSVLVLLTILTNLVVLRQQLKEERKIYIKNGVIFSEMPESRTTAEYLCKTIKSVKVSGPLIWLELPLARKSAQYLLIPTREFGSRWELDHFLEYFQRQQNIEPVLEPNVVRQIQQAEWHVEFNLDSDAWISVNTQVAAIKKSRLLGHSFEFGFLNIVGLIVIVGFFVLTVVRGSSVDVMMLIFILVLAAAIYLYTMHRPIKEADIRRQLKWGLLREDVIGPWDILLNEEGIDYVLPSASGQMTWNQMKWLAESDDWLFMFTPKGQALLFFEKALLGGNNKRLDFVAYCQERGLEYKRVHPAVVKKSTPLKIRIIKAFAVIIGIVVILFVGLLVTASIFAIKEAPQETQKQLVEATTSYVFNPGEYEHYVSLEEQVKVLRSLGFRISEEAIDNQKEWMEDWPEARTWVEGYPYTSLLTEVGYPKRNTETWEVESYSDQAYWFDFEGYDISSDYIHILEGINALSGGDFLITEMATDDSRVDWEKETGVMTVEFKLNGTAYTYQAKMHHDWLDKGILSYVGQLLDKEQVPGRLYAMIDNGQGVILFYRESAWAREFKRKTGLTLMRE